MVRTSLRNLLNWPGQGVQCRLRIRSRMAVPRTDRPPGYIWATLHLYIYLHVCTLAPVDPWSDLAKHCPWSKGQLIGMGSTVPLGTVPLVIPSPRRGMGSCFCVVSTFTIIIVAVVVNYWVRFHSSLEAISMKLGGYIGHGPNSSYPHFWHHMTCCHWNMTEN